MDQPSTSNDFQQMHCHLLKTNFEKLFEEPFPIQAPIESLGQIVYASSYSVLSHSNAAVPIFTYANLSAQSLWELGWAEITTMPSYQSAREDSQRDRAELLTKVQQDGCSKSYSGVRISSSGKRFEIKNVYVWNLYQDEAYVGQAALFNEWVYVDSPTGGLHSDPRGQNESV
ncbi:MAG: MEKHLA domain-containing protein [Pseudomonadota bacterium]